MCVCVWFTPMTSRLLYVLELTHIIVLFYLYNPSAGNTGIVCVCMCVCVGYFPIGRACKQLISGGS